VPDPAVNVPPIGIQEIADGTGQGINGSSASDDSDLDAFDTPFVPSGDDSVPEWLVNSLQSSIAFLRERPRWEPGQPVEEGFLVPNDDE
jgi:hypothetical protein